MNTAPVNHSALNAENLTRMAKACFYGLVAIVMTWNAYMAYVFVNYRIFGGV